MGNNELLLSYIFEGKPLSVNQSYYTDRYTFSRHKTKQYKMYENLIRGELVGYDLTNYIEDTLAIELIWESPEFFTKTKGAKSPFKRKDLDDIFKPLIDIIFGAMQLDDSQIFNLTAKKLLATKEQVTINIYTII
jgi:Holliday junction resolvase RusA-like endonuclease